MGALLSRIWSEIAYLMGWQIPAQPVSYSQPGSPNKAEDDMEIDDQPEDLSKSGSPSSESKVRQRIKKTPEREPGELNLEPPSPMKSNWEEGAEHPKPKLETVPPTKKTKTEKKDKEKNRAPMEEVEKMQFESVPNVHFGNEECPETLSPDYIKPAEFHNGVNGHVDDDTPLERPSLPRSRQIEPPMTTNNECTSKINEDPMDSDATIQKMVSEEKRDSLKDSNKKIEDRRMPEVDDVEESRNSHELEDPTNLDPKPEEMCLEKQEAPKDINTSTYDPAQSTTEVPDSTMPDIEGVKGQGSDPGMSQQHLQGQSNDFQMLDDQKNEHAQDSHQEDSRISMQDSTDTQMHQQHPQIQSDDSQMLDDQKKEQAQDPDHGKLEDSKDNLEDPEVLLEEPGPKLSLKKKQAPEQDVITDCVTEKLEEPESFVDTFSTKEQGDTIAMQEDAQHSGEDLLKEVPTIVITEEILLDTEELPQNILKERESGYRQQQQNKNQESFQPKSNETDTPKLVDYALSDSDVTGCDDKVFDGGKEDEIANFAEDKHATDASITKSALDHMVAQVVAKETVDTADDMELDLEEDPQVFSSYDHRGNSSQNRSLAVEKQSMSVSSDMDLTGEFPEENGDKNLAAITGASGQILGDDSVGFDGVNKQNTAHENKQLAGENDKISEGGKENDNQRFVNENTDFSIENGLEESGGKQAAKNEDFNQKNGTNAQEISIENISNIDPNFAQKISPKKRNPTQVNVQWTGNATEVFITGSWLDWSDRIQLEKSEENVWSAYVELDRNLKEIELKFVVDGVWLTSPDIPSVDDGHGNKNNIIRLMH